MKAINFIVILVVSLFVLYPEISLATITSTQEYDIEANNSIKFSIHDKLQAIGFPRDNKRTMVDSHALNPNVNTGKMLPGDNEYRYDDGSSELIFGLGDGSGEVCWMQWFESVTDAKVITAISASWGSPRGPGYCPPNGTPSTVYIWDDPNNDGDPTDCILLALKETVVQKVDTDSLVEIVLNVPVSVSGKFFIGCMLYFDPYEYGAPADSSPPYNGEAWSAGATVFDHNNLGNNDFLDEMGDIGYPIHWLLRATYESENLIVDDTDPEFVIYQGDPWNSVNHENAYGGSTHFRRSGDGSNKVAWRLDQIITPGPYKVYAWKFENQYSAHLATNAQYLVRDLSGNSGWIYVNQTTSGNEWVYLGDFEFDNGSTQGVALTDDADGFIVADAIKLVSTAKPESVWVDDDYDSGTPGWGYDHFNNIQEGVDSVATGGTVFVLDGTYNENCTLEKPLSLIGNGSGSTTIDGGGSGDVVYVYTDSVTISGFTIQNSGIAFNAGIMLEGHSDYNIISDNTISNNGDGIRFYYGDHNTISGNTISSNDRDGIELWESRNNSITNNTINSNYYDGVYLWHADSTTFTDNTFSNDGLFVIYSRQNTVSGNTVNGKTLVYLEGETGTLVNGGAGQVLLVNCDSITVQNQDISSTDIGILLDESDYCQIQNNRINSFTGIFSEGIGLYSSEYNSISGNNISYLSGDGIYLLSSDFNEITADTIAFNTGQAIRISDNCNDNTVSWSILANMVSPAVYCTYDTSTTFLNNTISQNSGRGLYLQGSYNSTIQNNEISSNTDDGITLLGGSYCTVVGNTISNNGLVSNGAGIWIAGDNHTISGNTLTGNRQGMYLRGSDSNTIANNTISYSVSVYYDGDGIFLDDYVGQGSDDNTISGNEISYNDGYGLAISGDNNIIYNNDFISNGDGNASEGGVNFWDNGYPDGGNYWDDHPGPLYDDFNGPDQDIPGSDDILDLGSPGGGLNPYDVGGSGELDSYPFLAPVTK
jgi:parallel beta-helix repeat protein